MTKEEYLKMYKEDKLAELCEQFEKDMNRYHDELIQYQNDIYKIQKKMETLSSYWESMDNLFEKIETLPAKDFIKLYYRMQDLIQDDIKSIPIRYNTDHLNFITAHN